jgi:hypothetical protein
MGGRGAPGKFYGKEAALTLLSTLRATGFAAHVIVDDSATVEEREHFRRFSARLQIGDIVSEDNVILFVSTSNPFYSSLLLWLVSISSSSALPIMVFCLKG